LPPTFIKLTRTLLALAISAGLLGQATILSQSRKAGSRESSPGKQVFAKNCSGCHGLDGSGTQRAPNIASGAHALQLSESEIFITVSKGVPDRGMPSFQGLGIPTLRSVVAYVRRLQGAGHPEAMPGNPDAGKQLFFGEALCSQCHMAAGKGGFIASDLSSYAGNSTIEEMRNAITSGEGSRHVEIATVTGADGQRCKGIIRNEDNFSLQLQAEDGTFHFFTKQELKAVDRWPASTMHADLAAKFNATQLNDMVSYLLSLKTNSPVNQSEHRPDEQ
jgi:cytochrome c oxidase cbb3-type subunit 3